MLFRGPPRETLLERSHKRSKLLRAAFSSMTRLVKAPTDVTNITPTEEDIPMDEAESLSRRIKVEIVAAGGHRSALLINFNLLVAREREMKETADHFGISADRWDGSRIYKEFSDDSISSSSNDTLRLELHPQVDCAIQNYSHSLQWMDWMTKFLQGYYTRGNLQIPDESRGYDVLLALEYFGILYQPHQLKFASYAAYARVKHWSDYFSHRCAMGDVIAEKILTCTTQQHSFWFAVTRAPQSEVLQLQKQPETDTVLPLVSVDPASVTLQEYQASACLAYKFFFASHSGSEDEGEDQPHDERKFEQTHLNPTDRAEAAAMMRQDFADYMQNILANTLVYFTVQPVKCLPRGIIQDRAILRIVVKGNPVSPPYSAKNRSTSQFSAPLDEVVNDLEGNVLDRLLSGVHKRNSKSPRHIAEFPSSTPKNQLLTADHVYEDLARESELVKPPTTQRTKYHFTDTAAPKKKPRAKKKVQVDFAASGAPVAVITAPTGSGQSVTSALTGPFADDDDTKSAAFLRSNAIKNEWLQASVFNQGISERIEAFMSSTTSESATPADGVDGAASKTPQMTSLRESFDWLTGLVLCDCPTSCPSPTVMDTVKERYASHEEPYADDGILDLKISPPPACQPKEDTAGPAPSRIALPPINETCPATAEDSISKDQPSPSLTNKTPESCPREEPSTPYTKVSIAPLTLNNSREGGLEISPNQVEKLLSTVEIASVGTPSTDDSRHSEIQAAPPEPDSEKQLQKQTRMRLKGLFRRRPKAECRTG